MGSIRGYSKEMFVLFFMLRILQGSLYDQWSKRVFYIVTGTGLGFELGSDC